MTKAFVFLAMLSIASSADPSCAYITAQPQYMHPGVPQVAAEAKCRGDCAQPGYNCETIARNYPTICTCGSSPSTPSPTPTPPAPAPGMCANPAYHQCGGNDGFSGDTCCPFYQGVQQVCHRESDQYWQCCPPDLHGCGAAFWTPYQNPETIMQVSGVLPSAIPANATAVLSVPFKDTTLGTYVTDCVTHVNALRKTKGLSALARRTSDETCTNGNAKYDFAHPPPPARCVRGRL